MKQKLFALLLAALLALGTAFCFAGCGGGNGSASTPSDPSTPSSPSSPSLPSTPSDTDPDDKTEPETPAEPSTPEEPDEKQDETPGTPEEPKENPDDTPTDPPAEKFSLAANREKIIENVMPLLDIYKLRKMGGTATIDKIYDLYLTTNETSTTLGVIFCGLSVTKAEYIHYGTITMPNQKFLSYHALCDNPEYNFRTLEFETLYWFDINPQKNIEYAATIEKIQRKVFENYDDALWLGWSGTNLMQSDKHTVVCYGYNTSKQLYEIQQVTLTIPNDGATLIFPDEAVNKYFLNNQYQIHDTYNGKKSTFTLTLPEDTLNTLIEKELQEAEQE